MTVTNFYPTDAMRYYTCTSMTKYRFLSMAASTNRSSPDYVSPTCVIHFIQCNTIQYKLHVQSTVQSWTIIKLWLNKSKASIQPHLTRQTKAYQC